jgi:acyl-CoA reductase-like NAD-dependent aldehyde dehydrogenase
MLTLPNLGSLMPAQRQFFATGTPKNLDFRKEQLKKLKAAVTQAKEDVLKALKADLSKPELEGYFDIISINQEIDYALKHLNTWVKPRKVPTAFEQFPATARIAPEPLGVVLIIGPWNYPFSLVISPLVGAIAAGNCAIIKPSELAPHTSAVVRKLIEATFASNYIAVIEGGIETSQQLLAEKFDHIFFTGGTKVGRIVMEAAARHLTPVTLELGGKSPCIVDKETNLRETAKRITWGKFINAGQTCIAPDYLLVDAAIEKDLVTAMQGCLQEFYGENPAQSPDYGRIINERQFTRLESLLGQGEILCGGITDGASRYIAPTLMRGVSLDSPLMEEEIFGPILPILTYQEVGEAIALINSRPKPLALYVFSLNGAFSRQVVDSTSSGGVCVNDTIMHVGVIDLPFGGVGDSGMGRYHGKASFETFSHYKSILHRSFRFDLNWRFPPYASKLPQLQRLFKT